MKVYENEGLIDISIFFFKKLNSINKLYVIYTIHKYVLLPFVIFKMSRKEHVYNAFRSLICYKL